MKKTTLILMLVATGFFSSGQNPTDSVKANLVIRGEDRNPTRAGLAKAIKTGTIYNSTSPHHNVLHEFTYLVAMRDHCNKTLLQMRAGSDSNKKLSKELERELLNAKAGLASSKFNGLKIESGLYELFLKQAKDRFRD